MPRNRLILSFETVAGMVLISGVIPTDWISVSKGVRYLAIVNFNAEPSISSISCCTEPLPKLLSPTITARLFSLSAPATISAPEALPASTSATIG